MTIRGYERIPTKAPAPGRLVLQGAEWRVVAQELPDNNGVLETVYTIELADGCDLMGVPRWRMLNSSKSGYSDWATVAHHFLHELLKRVGEGETELSPTTPADLEAQLAKAKHVMDLARATFGGKEER